MPLIESSSQSTGKPPAQAAAVGYTVQRPADYVTDIIPVAPESVTLKTLNENNRKLWAHAGGEQSGN